MFTNVLLADEINRSPPKTQSALLEAMEERQVTIEGTTHRLAKPFFVIATQNPIELEGTFPLPEAAAGPVPAQDVHRLRENPGAGERNPAAAGSPGRRTTLTDLVQPALRSGQFRDMQEVVESAIYADGQILDYVSHIVRATREHPAVEVGFSPRGGLALLKLSRAHAAVCGRDFVTPDDVKTFAEDALSHRIILNIESEIEGTATSRSIVASVTASIEPPRDFMRWQTR